MCSPRGAACARTVSGSLFVIFLGSFFSRDALLSSIVSAMALADREYSSFCFAYRTSSDVLRFSIKPEECDVKQTGEEMRAIIVEAHSENKGSGLVIFPCFENSARSATMNIFGIFRYWSSLPDPSLGKIKEFDLHLTCYITPQRQVCAVEYRGFLNSIPVLLPELEEFWFCHDALEASNVDPVRDFLMGLPVSLLKLKDVNLKLPSSWGPIDFGRVLPAAFSMAIERPQLNKLWIGNVIGQVEIASVLGTLQNRDMDWKCLRFGVSNGVSAGDAGGLALACRRLEILVIGGEFDWSFLGPFLTSIKNHPTLERLDFPERRLYLRDSSLMSMTRGVQEEVKDYVRTAATPVHVSFHSCNRFGADTDFPKQLEHEWIRREAKHVGGLDENWSSEGDAEKFAKALCCVTDLECEYCTGMMQTTIYEILRNNAYIFETLPFWINRPQKRTRLFA